MIIEPNSLPVSGSVLFAGVAWIGLSAFVLGPLLAERSAQKIGWQVDCEKQVVRTVAAQEPASSAEPMFGCGDVFGHIPYEQRQIMDMLGFGAACQMVDRVNDQKQRLLQMKRQALEQAVAAAGSKCSCAVAHMTMSKRWDLALAAGSARLVVPPSVANLRASLMESLASPSCAGLARVED